MTLQQFKLDIWRDICQLTIERNCRDKTGRTDSLIQNLDNLNQVQLMEIWMDNLDQSFSRISGVSDKKSIAKEIMGQAGAGLNHDLPTN